MSRVEIYKGYWTREQVAHQQDKVFLFGDNTYDRTKTHYIPSMTQAVIRGLPNAIGIDTKKNRWKPLRVTLNGNTLVTGTITVGLTNAHLTICNIMIQVVVNKNIQ